MPRRWMPRRKQRGKEGNMASDKKSTDEIKVSNTSDTQGKINVAGGDEIGKDISGATGHSNVKIFMRGLYIISARHNEKRGWILQLLYDVFRGRKEIEKVSSIWELKDLIRILTDKDFYKTTSIIKQQKYIRIMLDYLVREVPQDYKFILDGF